MLGLEPERLTTQSGETTYNASKWTSVNDSLLKQPTAAANPLRQLIILGLRVPYRMYIQL